MERRIKDDDNIKENIQLGITEVIDNPYRTKTLFIDLIRSAKSEILLILPTANAFLREYRIGAIRLLKELSLGKIQDLEANTEERERERAGKKTTIKILTPVNNLVNKIIEELAIGASNSSDSSNSLQIRYIQLLRYHVTTATIMVIDRKTSLVMEKVDDAKEEFNEAVGLSTYSTSRPTVASYVSIFENFWDQLELYEEHKKKDRLEREFINLAAHELRTPTQAVLGYIELALMEIDSIISQTGNVGQYISAAFRNALRLQRLTKDILDIARIESKTLKLNKDRIDLVETIDDAINDIKLAQVADKRITTPRDNSTNTYTKIEFIKPNRSIFINADRLRLHEVITNLLSNAINATRNKGCTGSITVSIKVVGGTKSSDTESDNNTRAIVSIKDNGEGIDPQIMAKLFTKFVTKSESGLGLGLYITKSLVVAHGGKIWAENNAKDKGATFSFSLPISED
jgi:signal transduction histidine kinase